MGQQRVCDPCAQSLRQTQVNRPEVSFTASAILLEDSMALLDDLQRSLGSFVFSLTEYGIRWSQRAAGGSGRAQREISISR